MFPISAGVTAQGRAVGVQIFEEMHTDRLFRLIEANRASLRQWLPWLDVTTTPADTANHIRLLQDQFSRGNGFSAGIWVDGELAGAIGLHAIDSRHRNSSIGYWLSESHRGGGVMTHACRATITAIFSFYHLHRIEIRCATGNTRSCAIPARLGFTHEGVLREAEWLYDHFVDLNVFSMLERDWPAAASTIEGHGINRKKDCHSGG